MKLPLLLCGHFPNGAFNVFYDLTYFIFSALALETPAAPEADTQAASNSKANSGVVYVQASESSPHC